MSSSSFTVPSHDRLRSWRDAAVRGDLPLPTRSDRWMPLRAGLVNMWEYDVAEVWFADGRVQLQGANESGKSTLMTLTTLLHLAGDISTHNIDTLGESSKRFRYYVEATNHPLDRRATSVQKSRGWAWVEYGRTGADGLEFFTTLLFAEARRADGHLKHHWCTAHQRHADAPLRVRSGIGLVTAGLISEPTQFRETPGFVPHRTATAYREELARTLFETDTAWLDQIVRILRVVRTPKIGDRLNLGFLTDAFRVALPPLADEEVGQLADGWEQLERMRNERDNAESALAAVAEFSRNRWRPWADAVIRSAADPVVATNNAFNQVTRDQRDAERAVERVGAEMSATDDRINNERQAQGRATAESETLQSQRSYKDAIAAAANAQLLGDAAVRAEEIAARSASRLTNAEAEENRAAGHLEEAEHDLSKAEQELAADADRLAERADAAGLADATAQFLPAYDTDRLRHAAEQRGAAIDHAITLAVEHAEAVRAGDDAARLASAAKAAVDRAQAVENEAAERLEAAIMAVAELLSSWAAHMPISLRPAPVLVEDWVRIVTDVEAAGEPAPVLSGCIERDHLAPMRRPLEARVAQLESRLSDNATEGAETEEELERVEAETDPRPDPPSLWQRRVRPEGIGVDGAPLWRLVEPTGSPHGDTTALLEATLDAAGILQAWVTPDGAYILARDGAETVWTAGDERQDHGYLASPGTETLRSVLRPADDAGTELHGVVNQLLHSVPYAATLPETGTKLTLSADGRWRHGTLAGTAAPVADGPQLLGASARATARARTIARLHQRLADLAAEAGDLRARSNDARDDLTTLENAALRLPSDAPVVAAVIRLREARSETRRLTDEADVADQAATETLAQTDTAAATLATHADQYRLPHGEKQLRQARDALAEYLDSVRDLVGSLKRLGPARDAARRASEDLKARHIDVTRAREEADSDHQEAQRARAKAEAATTALTQEVQDIIARVEALRRAIEQHGERLTELASERERQLTAKVRAESVLQQVEQRRSEAETSRETAVRAWFACVDSGLPGLREIADPRDRHVTAALESARAARGRISPRNWPDDPTATMERMQRVQALWARLADEVAILRSRLEPLGGRTVRTTPPGEGDTAFGSVEVVVDSTGVTMAPPTAVARLDEQLMLLRSSYDDELERTINELLGSAFIEHLRERLKDAEKLRDDINRKLAKNPTSTSGLVLRVVRSPVAEERAANDVLEALEQSFALLPTSTQEQVRQFLARRISDAQEAARATGDPDWRSRLAEILDYRRWFELRLEYRAPRAVLDGDGNGAAPAGGWRGLDRDDHSLLSGGAKVVTLLQPFVAALHAMYDQSRIGPRMMWLDEAFDGVDADNRAMMLRLLAACDMDWMIAGPSLIANSPTVPAAAVYEVRRAPRPLPGVALEMALWTGHDLVHVATPDPADLLDLADQAESEGDTLGGLFSTLGEG